MVIAVPVSPMKSPIVCRMILEATANPVCFVLCLVVHANIAGNVNITATARVEPIISNTIVIPASINCKNGCTWNKHSNQ